MKLKNSLIRKYIRIKNYILGLLSYFKFRIGDNQELYYKDLYYLSFFSKDIFFTKKTEIISNNLLSLKKKTSCNVGIVIYTTSMWSIERLYRLLDEDPAYNPTILVVPFSDAADKTFQITTVFFKDNKYCVKTFYDSDFCVNDYDLLIYTNPYISTDKYINLLDIRVDKLVAYVSYSYMLSDNLEKLELPIYLLSWKFFSDSVFYKEIIESKSRIYTGNAVFCGYPKMDGYYKSKVEKDNIKNKKVIIYAPHQSVNRSEIRYATFEKNGWFLLFLAEKYKSSILWIVKPHPLLRSHSVEAGLFNNESSYDDYLKCWQDTNAAKVLENGDYFDLFKESDAMITDSVSFLAEYQFTGKPLLMLDSGKQRLNDFGESIKNILYQCRGNDYGRIEQFVRDVIDENDPMKKDRMDFFNKNLSYTNGHDNLACDNIYKIFNKEIYNIDTV